MFNLKSILFLCGCLMTVSLSFAQKDRERLQKNRQGESMEFGEGECRLEEIEVVKFQDFGWNSNPDNEEDQKPYQVVVGRDIDYEGMPRSAVNWNWSFNSDRQWTGFSAKSKKYVSDPTTDLGTQKIPKTDLPDNNDAFGEANGVVRVTAETKKGEAFPIYLSNEVTETNLTPWSAKVFFLKDDESDGVPNWFEYWKQANPIVNVIRIPGIKFYNVETCSFNTAPTPISMILEYDLGSSYNPGIGAENNYGSNRLNFMSIGKADPSDNCGLDSPANVAVGYNGASGASNVIRIAEGCGFFKTRESTNTAPSAQLEGIHVFYSTVAHEVEHAKIFCEVWADGYYPLLDKDNDGYRDKWEETPRVADGTTYMFDPENGSDRYASYTGNPQDSPSTGTRYEEARCLAVEASLNLGAIDGYDWSFDPKTENPVQGKQW